MKFNKEISAVITGGASGLGAATAIMLSSYGIKVSIFDLDCDKGQNLASKINGLFCETDITNNDNLINSFNEARKINGQERILINCAGIAIGMKTASKSHCNSGIKHHDLKLFNKVIDVNLNGTFAAITKSVSGMMELPPITDDGERGVLINTSSIAAEDGQIGQVAYAASKGGIASMTLPMARDLASSGIRVVTIMPGLFKTPLFSSFSEEIQEQLANTIPFPSRLGKPEEYAKLVVHIIENEMLNGTCIRLDGSLRMGPK